MKTGLVRLRINIYMPSDKNYLKFCWVAIYSLFDMNRDSDIYVYLVSENIEESDLLYLRELERTFNQHIILIHFNEGEAKEKGGLKEVGHWSIGLYSCYWLFHYLLPEDVDKIMTLEVDTVMVGSVQNIYNIDLDGFYAASQGPEHSPKRHLEVSEFMGGDFFSSNLSVFNVKKIREEIEFNTILEKNREALGYLQQEGTFGLLFKDKIKYFSAKTACLHENCKSIEELGLKYIINAEKNVCLLHFPSYSDNAKPWNPVYIMPGFIKWWDIAQKSPYFEEYFLSQHKIYEENVAKINNIKKNISYVNILLCAYIIMFLLLECYCIAIKSDLAEAVLNIVFFVISFVLTLIIRKFSIMGLKIKQRFKRSKTGTIC